MCLKLRNLDISSSTFSGCAMVILPKVFHTTYDFGCFHLPGNEAERTVRSIPAPVIKYAPKVAEIVAEEAAKLFLSQLYKTLNLFK